MYDLNIKIVYMDKLTDIVHEYNNTYHRTIQMKPTRVKSSRYDADFNKENNDKDPKFEVSHHVRISNIRSYPDKVTLRFGLKKFLR